jgi:OOP family OmpA-OmpF porin
MSEPRKNRTGKLGIALLSLFYATLLFGRVGPAHADEEPELRLKGQTHLVELGLFAGMFIPPTEHELYDLGSGHASLERAAPDIGVRLAYLPWAFIGLEVEAALMPTATRLEDSSALVYGVRGHLIAQYPGLVAPFVVVGGGILGVSSDIDVLGDDIDGSFHFGGGAKFYASQSLAVRVDARANIAGRFGPGGREAYYEVLLGVSYVLGWDDDDTPPKPQDSDGDGLPDERDKCPNEAADTGDGCPLRDTDGDGVVDDLDKCPSEPAETEDGCPVNDSDGDGVLDVSDKCPNEPAETPNGCPVMDTDGDGFDDEKDKCPLEAGTHPVGCPPRDTDGDGLKDDKDLCPQEPETVNSYLDEDGCPDTPPEALKRFTGTIPAIQFGVNTAEIRPSSFGTLKQAAKVLKEYPNLRVTIRGHSDATGSVSYNKRLSLRRATAVRDYLAGKGVAADRLEVEGVGPDEPVADNNTAAGRRRNRRVEFKISSSGKQAVPAAKSVTSGVPAKPGETTPPAASDD